MHPIEDIILTLDKIFKDVYFDLEEHKPCYWILVGDYNTYRSEKFLKIIKAFRAKYPKLKFVSLYDPNLRK